MSFSGQKLQGPQGESVLNFGETHGQAYKRREAFVSLDLLDASRWLSRKKKKIKPS